MSTLARIFVSTGALAALLAVAIGAFGAHALRQRLAPDLAAVFQTGVQYHFYHALGLIAVGVALHLLPAATPLRWSGWLMAAGIVLFSGSLYALALTGVRGLGAITPIGGVAFLAAWALFAVGVLRSP